jgi:enoyl-CoA hydratase
MSDAPELIVRVEGAAGRLTLNRPRALNALTHGMCRGMADALLAWREDPAIALVLIDHAGDRGFCAGGDIRQAAASARGDGRESRAFFLTEYRLNHLLVTYPKPTVAVGDGLVMGGGAGLFLPCRYRVATERTVLAMPESAIGLFPDIGAAWHLTRIPGQVGVWAGLTGARLGPADCLDLGLATHLVDSAAAGSLKTSIVADPDAVDGALEQFAAAPGPSTVEALRPMIDRLFAGETVEAIIAALAADPDPFAADQLAILNRMSPQALKVGLRHMRFGAHAGSFAEVIAQDYCLADRSVRAHDFQEGVRAVIIDKDNAPRWDPPTLEAVTAAYLDAFFVPFPPGEAWTPLA